MSSSWSVTAMLLWLVKHMLFFRHGAMTLTECLVGDVRELKGEVSLLN